MRNLSYYALKESKKYADVAINYASLRDTYSERAVLDTIT